MCEGSTIHLRQIEIESSSRQTGAISTSSELQRPCTVDQALRQAILVNIKDKINTLTPAPKEATQRVLLPCKIGSKLVICHHLSTFGNIRNQSGRKIKGLHWVLPLWNSPRASQLSACPRIPSSDGRCQCARRTRPDLKYHTSHAQCVNVKSCRPLKKGHKETHIYIYISLKIYKSTRQRVNDSAFCIQISSPQCEVVISNIKLDEYSISRKAK